MKIHRHGWVHRLIKNTVQSELQARKERDMLEQLLEHAYEGLIITDPDGVILKMNQSYAKFLGKREEEVVGRPVTEVVENTRMHIVAKSGVPEIAQVQKISGHQMICSRIPIFEQGKVVAVVGKVMFQDLADLFTMTDKFKSLNSELEYYKSALNKQLSAKYSFEHIVGSSKELEWVKELGKRVARSNTTVLVKGESGTGKELFAHAIHIESQRALGPFIKVNCAAIPENLFEAELFGYKEGAFTGARTRGKRGRFAMAHQGTIFLDEISELPLTMQVKLLRVLQEREIEPVGAERPEPVDVRIIAASNRDLETLVRQGLFRHDLYYRLNVVMLEIPPLRERRDDIPQLIRFHLRQLEKETGIPVEGVDREVEEIFMAYDWPGNIRELRNVLEQTLYVKSGTIVTKQDLPRALARTGNHDTPPDHRQTLKYILQQVEEEAIRRTIQEERGDKLAAAARLGISKSSLYAKIGQYEISS